MTDANLGRIASLLVWSVTIFALLTVLAIPITAYLLLTDNMLIPLTINTACLLTLPLLNEWVRRWLKTKSELLEIKAREMEADLRQRMTILRVTTKEKK